MMAATAADAPHQPIQTVFCSPGFYAHTTSAAIEIREQDENALVEWLIRWARQNQASFRLGHAARSSPGDELDHELITITTPSDVVIGVYQEDVNHLAHVMIMGFSPGHPCAVHDWDWKQDWYRIRSDLRKSGYKVR